MHGARDEATSGSGLRRAGVAAVVAVLVLAVLAVGLAVLRRPRAAAPVPELSTATAPVIRGTVTQRIQIAGVLGFDGTYQVAHQGQVGILTSAPRPGAVVRRGGVLYRVGNHPVRLLFGTLPAYRDFAAGMPDGPDVNQCPSRSRRMAVPHDVLQSNGPFSCLAPAGRRTAGGDDRL